LKVEGGGHPKVSRSHLVQSLHVADGDAAVAHHLAPAPPSLVTRPFAPRGLRLAEVQLAQRLGVQLRVKGRVYGLELRI